MFPRYLCKSELALFFFYNINEIFKGHLSISANVRYHRISQLFLSKFSAISHMRIKDSQLSVRLCQGKGTNDILSLNFRQQRSQQRGTLTKLRHGTPPPPPHPPGRAASVNRSNNIFVTDQLFTFLMVLPYLAFTGQVGIDLFNPVH